MHSRIQVSCHVDKSLWEKTTVTDLSPSVLKNFQKRELVRGFQFSQSKIIQHQKISFGYGPDFFLVPVAAP